MEQKKLDRINELARKKKAHGLTQTEKEEQDVLRQEYIGLIRKNMRGTLDNTSVKYPDGTIKKVKRKK